MEIKISIPSSLSEIKLGQYKRYIACLKAEEDQGETYDTFITLKMLEIFCNIPYTHAQKIKVNDINRIIKKIADVLNTKQDLVQHFTIGKTEFGFIPKIDDMSFGEYIDLDNYLGDWQKMEKAMAVLYRPITKKNKNLYRIEEYKGDLYHDLMNEMPLDAVFSSIVFFYNLGIELSIIMTKYLETDPIAKDTMLSQGLTENGAGITQFTTSLKGMLKDLEISLN